MSWLDFIGNIGTNIKEGMGNVANKIRYANAPQIQPLQMAENGGIDAQKTLELALAQPKSLGERLGGRTVNVDFQTTNPETSEIEVSRISKYQPGLLNDIRSGARENFATGFAAPNWEQNITPDGRKKGLGYRFGEGLGSFARFAESPLGRGLLMAGIVGASGGSGLEALGYGAGAGLGNQQARMKDSIYRNSLIEQGQNSLRNTPGFANLDPAEQQAQLDRIANRVNSYRGYLGDDTYKQVLAGMQMQDNAAYRNALLASNLKNQEIDNEMARERFNYTKQQDAKELALGWAKLKADKEKRGTASFSEISSMRKEFSGIPAIKNYNEIKRQVGNVTNTYNAYKSGKLKANAADQTMVTTLNKILDPTSVVRESEFARTAAGQSLLARMEGYANKMTKGGGGLTDAEREDLYAAMMEMYRANEDEANAYIQSYTDLANRYGINPADIMPRQYYQSSQPASTGSSKSYSEGTIIKDKQGNRLIMRGGQWQAI